MGNPLLDVSAVIDPSFLSKYGVSLLNDASRSSLDPSSYAANSSWLLRLRSLKLMPKFWQKTSISQCIKYAVGHSQSRMSLLLPMHAHMFCPPQEMAKLPGVEYIPGGATQNSIRIAQWLLQVPGATSYMGCVGKDDFGNKMKETATQDGVNVRANILTMSCMKLTRRS